MNEREVDQERRGSAVSFTESAEGLIGQIYQGFLLRDLFGKALPGAILFVAVSWLVGIGPDQLKVLFTESFSFSFWHWGTAIGIAWLLGFVTQVPSLLIEHIVVRWRHKGWEHFYREHQRFSRLYRVADGYLVRQRTRLTLLYEASANICTAFVVLAIAAFLSGSNVAKGLAMLAVAWFVFAWVHFRRAHLWQKVALQNEASQEGTRAL
jgi:hypothetical protein